MSSQTQTPMSIYILQWHDHGVTIRTVEAAPGGVDRYRTWADARAAAVVGLRARAQTLRRQAQDLETAVAELICAREIPL